MMILAFITGYLVLSGLVASLIRGRIHFGVRDEPSAASLGRTTRRPTAWDDLAPAGQHTA